TRAAAADDKNLIVYDVAHNTTRSLPLSRLACSGGFNLAVTARTVALGCRSSATTGPAGFVQRVDISAANWRVDPPTGSSVWPDVLRFSPDGRVIGAQTTTARDSSLQPFTL